MDRPFELCRRLDRRRLDRRPGVVGNSNTPASRDRADRQHCTQDRSTPSGVNRTRPRIGAGRRPSLSRRTSPSLRTHQIRGATEGAERSVAYLSGTDGSIAESQANLRFLSGGDDLGEPAPDQEAAAEGQRGESADASRSDCRAI